MEELRTALLAGEAGGVLMKPKAKTIVLSYVFVCLFIIGALAGAITIHFIYTYGGC